MMVLSRSPLGVVADLLSYLLGMPALPDWSGSWALEDEYERLRERYQAERLAARRAEGRAERLLAEHKSALLVAAPLHKEIERLRALNGENYRKYVRARECYEALIEHRRPNL